MRKKLFECCIVLAVLVFGGSILNAAPLGEWTEIGMEVNSGNVYLTIAAANDQVMIAFGAVNNGQGQTQAVFRRSVNGGQSWSAVTVPSFGGLYTFFTDMQMINENLGYAVGVELGFSGEPNVGPIWKVTNKGGTLEVLPAPEKLACEKIFCLDGDLCWLTCPDGKILKVTDEGQTFNIYTLPVTDLQMKSIHFIDENEGWCVGQLVDKTEQENGTVDYDYHDRGTVFHTTNGGQDWEVLKTGYFLAFTDIQFANKDVGYFTAYDETYGYLYKTTNGGVDWEDVDLPQTMNIGGKDMPLFSLAGVELFDENHGWVVGQYGTKDGSLGNLPAFYYMENGRDWTMYGSKVPDGNMGHGATFSDLYFLNEHMGFAVGDMLILVKYDDGNYVPPVQPDGDVDGDMDWDGEGEAPGPSYSGDLGEPCPVPGMDRTDTHDYPKCVRGNNEKTPKFCMFEDSVSFCSMECEGPFNCPGEWQKVCCQPLNINGEEKKVCIFDEEICGNLNDYSDEWHSYLGPVVGEECQSTAKPDLETCDENYGGEFCLDENPPYCSQRCTSDADCMGGFTAGCCTGSSSDFSYCQFAQYCAPEPDGDQGDIPADGDQGGDNVDGDHTTPVDGDMDSAIGPGQTSDDETSSGCASSAAGSAVLMGLMLALALVFRRKWMR